MICKIDRITDRTDHPVKPRNYLAGRTGRLVELDEGLESMIEIPRDQDNQLKAAMDVAVNGLEEAEKRVEESAAALEAEDGAEEGAAGEGQ